MSCSEKKVLSSQGKIWDWQENFLEVPIPIRGGRNGRTHAIDGLRDGRIVLFHQSVPGVLLYMADGRLERRFGAYPGAHGLTVVERSGEEMLWLTDEILGTVELVDLRGKVLQKIDPPDHPAYLHTGFSPTWVAEESRAGRPLRIWVADGYGAGLVHAYDGEGQHEFSLDGSQGAGLFDCPHGLSIDPRPGKNARLLVADRGNRRVQEFDRDGKFLGTWGSGFFQHPNGFDFYQERMLVSELFGRVMVLDGNNQTMEIIGEQTHARDLPGWPDVNRAELLKPGFFNSPHHACWGPEGEIYVVEWIKGGRVTRLIPRA